MTDESLRIALIIERLYPARGGRERSTAEVAVGLARRGCRVSIVCMEGALDAAVGAEAQDALRLVTLGRRGATRAARLRAFAADVADHLAKEVYDFSHAMLPLVGADVYQLRGGTLPGLRDAHLRALGLLERPLRRWTWPLNRARAMLGQWEAQVAADERTWCLPVSTMIAEELDRYYGRTRNVRVVFNAADAPEVPDQTRAQWRSQTRREWGLGEHDLVLLMPAMDFGLKGGREALAALASAVHGQKLPVNPRLVVLGGGGLSEGHERLVAAGSLGGHVVFRPVVADIWAAYAAADAVLLLSWYDPCSRVVLEAAGFGVPSITTAFNGAAEILTAGAGIVVPRPDDRRAVVEALVRMADPRERAAMAQACRALAPRVRIERHVDELLGVYREIAEQ